LFTQQVGFVAVVAYVDVHVEVDVVAVVDDDYEITLTAFLPDCVNLGKQR